MSHTAAIRAMCALIFLSSIGCENESKEKPRDTFCDDHNIPPELCTRSNPALAQVFKAKGDWCEAHRTPMSFCPIDSPNAKVPNLEPEQASKLTRDEVEGRVVRLRSPELETSAGLKVVKARASSTGTTVGCLAELEFSRNGVADVRAVVPGVVRSIKVDLGQRVKKGDALFVLESTRIGDVQSTLQSARERVRVAESNLKRVESLRAQQIASVREVETAQNELSAARAAQRAAASTLRLAGAKSASGGRFTLSAPIDGEVVARPAVIGTLATESDSLATIAQTETLWAECTLSEKDALRVSVGHELVVANTRGEVTWVSPEVDPRTRMVVARAEISNADRKLRAHQFVKAEIVVDKSTDVTVVPRRSVQRVEEFDVVFVRRRTGMFAPKVVRVVGEGDWVAVEGDISAGDEVVTDGALLLRTEVLPGSIGAGCCEVGVQGEE